MPRKKQRQAKNGFWVLFLRDWFIFERQTMVASKRALENPRSLNEIFFGIKLAEEPIRWCFGAIEFQWSKKLWTYLKQNIYLLFVDIFPCTLKLNATRASNSNCHRRRRDSKRCIQFCHKIFATHSTTYSFSYLVRLFFEDALLPRHSTHIPIDTHPHIWYLFEGRRKKATHTRYKQPENHPSLQHLRTYHEI